MNFVRCWNCKMKVYRTWNEWYEQCWLALLLLMMMPKQDCILAAVVDSEIYKSSNSNSSSTDDMDSGIQNIERHAWPPMKNHDIWSDESAYASDDISRYHVSAALEDSIKISSQDEFEFVANNFENDIKSNEGFAKASEDSGDEKNRTSKVLHIFPVPVDGECLSDDGRRIGTCFNAYQCHQKGGSAKGECARGFGVCCIFLAKCNDTISNNITYLVSPQFPSFMPDNVTSCSIKIKLMSEDISQLRIDFQHFSLGQPNRRTGVCDGDVFNISGGPAGTFSLCGQNGGQHLYYDVAGRSLPRQTLYGSLRPPTLAQLYPNLSSAATVDPTIDISMNFAQRFLPIRLWEIRIAQIPFSQRAPAGCLQYHVGAEGIIRTFNFADNGRHLANQHYRVCMRQETEMCSIMYQPCDEQSFRIGPSLPLRGFMEQNVGSGSGGGTIPFSGIGTMQAGVTSPSTSTNFLPVGTASADVVPTFGSSTGSQISTTAMLSTISTTSPAATMRTSITMSTLSTTTLASSTSSSLPTTTTTTTTTTVPSTTPSTVATTETTTTITTTPASTTSTSTTIATSPLSDDIEGSGDDGSTVTSKIPRRPRPVSGGFNLLGFLRSAFQLGLGRKRRGRRILQPEVHSQRHQRQIFSTCSDRITLPCIIEDFIGTGLGPLPSCEPVHCGTQFCSSGIWPCRIESTVTPFFVNIHFGDGIGKGNAEDNIGACLRYTQMQCM